MKARRAPRLRPLRGILALLRSPRRSVCYLEEKGGKKEGKKQPKHNFRAKGRPRSSQSPATPSKEPLGLIASAPSSSPPPPRSSPKLFGEAAPRSQPGGSPGDPQSTPRGPQTQPGDPPKRPPAPLTISERPSRQAFWKRACLSSWGRSLKPVYLICGAQGAQSGG